MLIMENANRAETRLHEKIRRELGPDFMSALDDQLTIEIMLNPDGELWQERLGEPMKRIGQLSASQADAAIRTVAGCLNKTATQDNNTRRCVSPRWKQNSLLASTDYEKAPHSH